MDIEEKKKAILEARQKFSKTQLDQRGKGRYILSLERNESIAEKKVDEIYENLLRLEEEAKGKENLLDNELDKNIAPKLDKKIALQLDKVLDKMKARFQQLEKAVHELDGVVNLILAKQKGLEERIASLESSNVAHKDKQEQGKDSQIKKLLGFALVLKKTSSAGKQYMKWYAVKRIEGKQVWIYIGDDISKAEEKIKEWIKNHKQ